jgi:hypothetical protein
MSYLSGIGRFRRRFRRRFRLPTVFSQLLTVVALNGAELTSR